MPKTTAHIRYRNKNNEIVPGCSTIANMLDKPALVPWANKLGLQGIDSRAFANSMADIGILTHHFIMSDLKGEKPDTSDYSQEQIDKAETSYLQWLEWKKDKVLEPVILETPMVSEQYQFGGTPDYLGCIDKVMVLADYKTGGIYKEHFIQCCGYRQLAIENGYPAADKILILGLPRNSEEKFQEVSYKAFDIGWQIFYNLRQVYELLKEVR